MYLYITVYNSCLRFTRIFNRFYQIGIRGINYLVGLFISSYFAAFVWKGLHKLKTMDNDISFLSSSLQVVIYRRKEQKYKLQSSCK